MSDTAAFFAKKKTKKKKFKSFNANKIDASAVTTSTHVDAPEISTAAEDVTTSLGGLSGLGKTGGGDSEELGGGDDQWADSQGGWGSNNHKTPGAASSGDSKVAELLDMQSLQARRDAEDNVAERLRIEETKAQLAKAKEGMAKEAERLAAEKEANAATSVSGMGGGGLGGASALGGGGGGKWVPSHMRSAGVGSGISGMSSRSSVRGPAPIDGGSRFQKQVDMASEELFPDLAEADKILAEKERQERENQERMVASVTSRAPAGWGARMGPGGSGTALAQRKLLNLAPPPAERKPLNLAPPKRKEEGLEAKKAFEEEEKEQAEEVKPTMEEATLAKSPDLALEAGTLAAVPAAVLATVPAAGLAEICPPPKVAEKPKEKKVLKKKKKKDLSTFKPKS